MPNHVTNELIFSNLSEEIKVLLLTKICNADGEVDFDILVPAPLNLWCGNVGSNHKAAFKRNHLDWARENWGTKWNAYQHQPIEQTQNTLILKFDTAWSPPYPWLAAVFNFFKISFEHNYFNEGEAWSVHGVFNYPEMEKMIGSPWKEEKASNEIHRRLHFIKYGCEEFSEEE